MNNIKKTSNKDILDKLEKEILKEKSIVLGDYTTEYLEDYIKEIVNKYEKKYKIKFSINYDLIKYDLIKYDRPSYNTHSYNDYTYYSVEATYYGRWKCTVKDLNQKIKII